jgi:hypothetical protein
MSVALRPWKDRGAGGVQKIALREMAVVSEPALILLNDQPSTWFAGTFP